MLPLGNETDVKLCLLLLLSRKELAFAVNKLFYLNHIQKGSDEQPKITSQRLDFDN